MPVISGRPDLLTPRQQEANRLLAGRARHVLLYGGARSGKTLLIVRAIILRALKAPGSRHAIFRFRYNAVRQSVWLDTWERTLVTFFPGLKADERRQDGYVEMGNGSRILFGGLDEAARVERVLGLEFATIMINEASQVPYSSVLISLTRLAQSVKCVDGTFLKQRAYMDTNPPNSGHYTNRLFIQHRDPTSRAPLTNPEDYACLQMNPTDNPNLSPDYLRSLSSLPDRQRRRFLEGEFTDDTEGALWPLELLERARWPREVALPAPIVRLVVAIDPSGAKGVEDKRSDEIGIVACALLGNGQYAIVEDATCRDSADGWAGRAIELLERHRGDRIVAEVNYGGDLVRATIQLVGRNRNPPVEVPFSAVHASRGKVQRAEPIAALFEAGKVLLWGRFPELEDQLQAFATYGYIGERSPDRGDAALWGLTFLSRGGIPEGAGVPSGIVREAPPGYLPPPAPSVLPVPGDIGMLG